MDQILGLLASLAPGLLYLTLGAGAALENIVPPIPADTFVLLGGFLAALGRAEPVWVFVVTWGANVTSALVVYRLGYLYGRPFFDRGWGRWLLTPGQLGRMRRFFSRWGFSAIFFTRFIPGFRAVVPVFAGITHQPFLPVAVPVLTASALWYGGLVWVGAFTGRNVDTLLAWLTDVNRGLLILAGVLAVAVGWWWWHSRHGAEPRDVEREEDR